MVDGIKIGGYVAFYYPKELNMFLGEVCYASYGVHGATVWSKAKGILAEIRFKDGL